MLTDGPVVATSSPSRCLVRSGSSENTGVGRPLSPDGPIPQQKPKRPPSPPKVGLGQVSKPNPADRPRGYAGERYDAYGGVLFLIPGTRLRVAASADGLCWIVQHREGRDHWVGRKYFSNRRRLATVLRELVPATAFRSVEAKIAALPV